MGTLAILLIGWQLIGSHINPVFLSTPTAIASKFVQLVEITSGHYSLIGATVETLEAVLIGFLISIVVGFPIGLLMGVSRRVDTMLNPFVSALYVTPRIALIPLFVIWFGVSIPMTIATAVLLAVFPIIINTYAGVRNMGKSFLETANVFQIRGIRRLQLIIFPSLLPFFMTGVRLAIGQAMVGVVIGQVLGALAGLGYMIIAFSNYFETASVLVIVVVLMIIGVILTYGIRAVEDRLAHWKLTERGY